MLNRAQPAGGATREERKGEQLTHPLKLIHRESAHAVLGSPNITPHT